MISVVFCGWLFKSGCFVMAVMGFSFRHFLVCSINCRNFLDVALLCWSCSIMCSFLFGFPLGRRECDGGLWVCCEWWYEFPFSLRG